MAVCKMGRLSSSLRMQGDRQTRRCCLSGLMRGQNIAECVAGIGYARLMSLGRRTGSLLHNTVIPTAGLLFYLACAQINLA